MSLEGEVFYTFPQWKCAQPWRISYQYGEDLSKDKDEIDQKVELRRHIGMNNNHYDLSFFSLT